MGKDRLQQNDRRKSKQRATQVFQKDMLEDVVFGMPTLLLRIKTAIKSSVEESRRKVRQPLVVGKALCRDFPSTNVSICVCVCMYIMYICMYRYGERKF